MSPAAATPEIILHHYPRSPFAEKLRVAFGFKGLTWRSVLQPRIAPKPMLTPLTGGYRRIPVLQIGADVFCDTRRILAELEARYPTPSLYPAGTSGQADMIAEWADRCLFPDALGLVFGLNGASFPPELHADRAQFTQGRFDGWDSVKMKARLPALRDQFRIHLAWLEDSLADSRSFLLGSAPSLADLATYHPLWYASENLGADAGLAVQPRLRAWMARMSALGHGSSKTLAPEDALAIARDAQPAGMRVAANVAQPWLPGARLSITPVDWGFDSVTGDCVACSSEAIALRRHDADLGEVIVHFPLAGFAVAPA